MNAAVKDYFVHQEEELIDFLLKNIEPTLQPSAFKSKEDALKETKQVIRMNLDQTRKDIVNGYQLFLAKTTPEEKKTFTNLMSNLYALANTYIQKKPLNFEKINIDDFSFLEEIAKRELIARNFNEASCMFRFIIQLNPVYSMAWVGCALSEYEQKNIETAEQIFELGMQILPEDLFIPLYAAQFFIITQQLHKALTILQTAKEKCLEKGMEKSEIFKEINLLLKSVK